MRKHVFFSIMLVAALAMGATVVLAQSTTTLSNVAAFQTVDSSPAYAGNIRYAGFRAVDTGLYAFFNAASVDPGDEQYNYWKLDFGQTWDVDHLTIYARPNDYSVPRINGATMFAFGADGVTRVTDDWVITGFLQSTEEGGPLYVIDVDNGGAGWNGVQYFQIGGTDPNIIFDPPGYGVAEMTILEFQAWAQVPVYDTFIQGITATATYTYGPHPGVSPEFLVDNSGMDDQHTLLGDPAAMHNNVFGAALWHVQGDEPPENPQVTFDLGDTYDLDQIVIWNEDQMITRCTKEVLIESSTNGTTWTALDDTNGEELGNYTFTAHSGEGGPYAATDTLAMNDLTASYIRFTILSNYSDTGTLIYTGLSEVRFYGTEGTNPVLIPGDTNGDQIVDGDDAAVLAANWGASVTAGDHTSGDFNGDGVVDVADASIMAAQWGNHNEAAGAVPEPSTLVMLVSLFVLAFWRRRAG